MIDKLTPDQDTAPDRTPCVLYAAKSTEDKHGSIPTQLADCRALAEREGWEVLGEFQDEGFSAYSGNRGPGLEEAKDTATAAASARGACILVAQDADRFARGAGDAPGAADHLGEVYFAMKRSAVRLWTYSRGELDALHAVLEGERAHSESARKNQSVKDGKDRQRARRERPGGPVQDGYRKRPIIDAATGDRIATAFEIDPKREPTIRRMFKLIVGGMAFKPCADKLNAEGHVSTTGLPWNRRSVEDKATHPFYAGAVVWYRGKPGEEIIWSPATEHPAYITREQHEAILAARSRRDRAKGSDRRPGTGRPNAYHLLAGLAFCARCGAKMRARRTGTYKGRAYRGYRCATAEDYPGTCDAPTIRIEDLDGPLLDALPGLMVDFEGWIDGQLANRSESKERIEAQLGAQVEALATVDRRIAKLADRYADAVGADDDDRADREAEVLDRERSKRPEIERRIAELEVGLEATDQPTQHDAALDWWNDLRSDLAAAKGSDTLIDARSRLAARFARVVLDTAGEEIVIRFELHEEAGGAVLDVPIEEEPGAEHVFILGQSGTPFPPQPVPTRVPAGNARNAHE